MKRRYKKSHKKRGIKRGIRLPLLLAALAVLAAAATVVWSLASARGMRVLNEDQIKSVLAANEYGDERIQTVTEAAVSLVGKVHYFWGGKSYCIGPDPAWGEMRTVTSEGSADTGSKKPFGLDCSGYVTWAFMQLGEEDMLTRIGEGTWAQWQNSQPIEWDELTAGDLVFQNPYPGSNGNHVGVCIGKYRGRPVFAHCSAAHDNVVVTTAGSVFRYARRPSL